MMVTSQGKQKLGTTLDRMFKLDRKSKVVISAADQDRSIVNPIIRMMSRTKFEGEYMTDYIQSGDILEKIDERVRSCKIMVAVNTKNTSFYPHEEWAIAHALKKPILIFNEKGVVLKGAFSNFQKIEFDLTNLNDGIKKLVEALTAITNQESFIGKCKKHKKALIAEMALIAIGLAIVSFQPYLPIQIGVEAAIGATTLLKLFRLL